MKLPNRSGRPDQPHGLWLKRFDYLRTAVANVANFMGPPSSSIGLASAMAIAQACFFLPPRRVFSIQETVGNE
jgi:hypothetical protein